jgi:hypothetical protein
VVTQNDVHRVTNEILASVSAIYDETLKSFIKLVNLVENKIFKPIHMRQLHSCKKIFIKPIMVANMVFHML